MKRTPTRLTIASVSVALATLTFCRWSNAGGWRRSACCYPSLPRYNYQTAITPLRATLATYPVVGDTSARKVFQPLANDLIAGDCALSQPGLVLYPDGSYVLSFRATNTANTSELGRTNAALTISGGTSIRQQQGVEVGPVRHHRLLVKVRFYSGSVPAATRSPNNAPGVVLAECSVDPFLVTAREERVRLFSGLDLILKDHYGEISQVEFELNVDPDFPVPAR